VLIFSILSLHCTISLEGGTATLHPAPGSLCLVNAAPVDAPVRLSQGCVIVLGTYILVFSLLRKEENVALKISSLLLCSGFVKIKGQSNFSVFPLQEA
jgi:predicted component of type VI protein secretion system